MEGGKRIGSCLWQRERKSAGKEKAALGSAREEAEKPRGCGRGREEKTGQIPRGGGDAGKNRSCPLAATDAVQGIVSERKTGRCSRSPSFGLLSLNFYFISVFNNV
ncbi:hypothetical protein FF1_019082 [Malus domestica]